MLLLKDIGMEQKALQLVVVLLSVFALGACYQLTDIAFPCERDSASVIIFKALDFVCIGDKQDPIFEKFLNENGKKRDKRDLKLLNTLTATSLSEQQIEEPWNFSTDREAEISETSQNGSHENNSIIQNFLSNLKSSSTLTRISRRLKREEKEEEQEDEGPNLYDKIMSCCEYSHRVKTSCTLRDLKPYCWAYIGGPKT